MELICVKTIFFAGRLWSPGERREAIGDEPECSFKPEGEAVMPDAPRPPKEPKTLHEIQTGKSAPADDFLS